ncbi:Ig-like domain repeat protein [Streptomyces sp. NPDC005281]|uniref:Ig-like domain repeat protein n=2 Tax=unclassified Streptomyces TaxID=2593676 RepID=UPI0033AAF139
MRTLPMATALAVAFSSVALAVGTATTAAADSSKILPVKSVGDIVVDGVHRRVFVSDPSNGKIVVTDYSGTVVKQITSLPGVQGLELSADSGTLYAAVPGGNDAIVAIDTATATQSDRYPTGNLDPKYPALAGGKLWFGYGSAGSGNIGSVDLTGPEHKVTPAQDADSPWFAAPMLASSPGAPGQLVAGIPVQSPLELAVYDVSSDTVVRTAHTSPSNGGSLADLAVTPDGKDVVVAGAGPNAHTVYRTSDLSEDGTYRTVAYPNAVDIAPNGMVAAGSFAWYDPDVYVFRAGATSPLRQYDFPNTGDSSGADTLAESGLAWAPDESRLFAVSSNSLGVYSLRVLVDAAKPATAITVSAPATATRAKKLTVKGKVTSKEALPAGVRLTLTRTDLESPGGKSIGSVAVAADGTYSFADTPTVGGSVKYTAAYAGDAGHAAGSGSDTVAVSRTTPTLTLNNNGKVYSYGADVKFTAHLGSTYKNRKVEIWADPYGSDKPNTRVKSGTVDSSGNLSVTLDLKRDATVTAKFAGDAHYGSKSVASKVGARVSVSTAVTKHYTTRSVYGHTYYYFHQSTDPVFTTTMTAYPGRRQRLQIQAYSQGSWVTTGTQYFALSSSGKSQVTVTGTPPKNVRFRVRDSYINGSSGDTVNSTTDGAWKYFLFTG